MGAIDFFSFSHYGDPLSESSMSISEAARTLLPIGGSLYAMSAKIGVITALLGVTPNKTKFTSRIRWTMTIVWLACKSWYNSETFPRVTIKDPKACQIDKLSILDIDISCNYLNY